ncbi:MAG: fibronectin type III domain-containing protein, partial [Chitinophagia bacterium]|nr:fibronectin type III domain-containing protein [Chitinophagia bacterium]
SSWNIDSSTNASTQFKRVSYLSNATLFYFRVYARNLGGNGSSSNVVNVIPFTVPSAPIITATAGNRFIQLSWDAPNNNGRDISSYIIEQSIDSITWDITYNTTNTSYNVTDLSNGTLYYFRVYAINLAGNSLLSNLVNARPVTVPSAPTITAVAGNGLIDLSWTVPANNNIDITSYIIERSTDSYTWNFDSSTNSTTLFKRVSNLSNGVTYYFRVYAINLAGNGLLSNVVNEIPCTVPNQIESIALLYSKDRVDLSWNAPFNGDSNIIEYFIRKFIVSSNTLVTSTNVVETYYTINGFGDQNGQELRVNISARNKAGYSISTDVYFIPFTVPSAPTLTA